MSYSESAEGMEISKDRALRELTNHGVTCAADVAAFFAEMGDRETYDAEDVLRWLGYQETTMEPTITLTSEEARIYDKGGYDWSCLRPFVIERAQALSAQHKGLTVEVMHPDGFVFDLVSYTAPRK